MSVILEPVDIFGNVYVPLSTVIERPSHTPATVSSSCPFCGVVFVVINILSGCFSPMAVISNDGSKIVSEPIDVEYPPAKCARDSLIGSLSLTFNFIVLLSVQLSNVISDADVVPVIPIIHETSTYSSP